MPVVLVGHHREGRHLGARARRRRDRHELRLHPELRELVDALADVHEAQRQVLERDVGSLVHHPHDLGGVHRRTAAERQDDIGLEGIGEIQAPAHDRQRRVGRDLEKGFHLHAEVAQDADGLVDIAVVEQEAVGHDQAALVPAQVFQREGQAAPAEIDRARKFVAEHVLRPLGDHLAVQQVLRPDVFGDRVAAPGAAAQGQRRRQPEIVEIADAAL